ncbi:glycosyltransferase family 39 protein [Mucilaginibacter limnophilus]|uniref:Glycosyltransferase family 39 protein n=1 Tax=Mucilaginibacter limnophilus TaxID=1932778 RepID=A0A3S2UM98_9SPHI|nr:glycosyltransferase family 39 protein [Mucilaginibacter limnophilus]RVT98191.1 glycosyltransferase family 39 protein [Mucilaginibacter limnophilus]
MVDNTINIPARGERYIKWFLFLWTALNILQACTLELHADEAYYWMYSRLLDWGYFDHPPMVALFIRPGDIIIHNQLGLRLINILSSTATLYLLWLIAKKYKANALWFILIAGGMFTLHIYGFITTPDGPLLFFTALFFYAYQKYLDDNKWWQAVLLGIIVACLLYSKYHAVLLIGFTVLANFKLLTRWTFWLIVLVSIGLYIPHILWQVENNYPSVAYHLADRSEKTYRPDYTLAYIASQTLMAGVLTGWLLFYRGFNFNFFKKDAFARCLQVNFIGIMLFFLISSIRGEVQPQWTIIAFAALLILMLIYFAEKGYPPKWFKKLAIANIIIIVAIRLLLVAAPPFVQKMEAVRRFFGYREEVLAMHKKAGDNWVMMDEGFQMPSRYNFYNNTLKAFSYDSRYYRLTQFEIWPLEDSIQNKKVHYISTLHLPFLKDSIVTGNHTWYTCWIDSVRTYQKISIDPGVKTIAIPSGKTKEITLKITNPYSYPVSFSNEKQKHKVFLEACFFKLKNEQAVQSADTGFNNIILQPGQNIHYKFKITAPKQKGRYDLLFSIRTEPFSGSRNSGIITFTSE